MKNYFSIVFIAIAGLGFIDHVSATTGILAIRVLKARQISKPPGMFGRRDEIDPYVVLEMNDQKFVTEKYKNNEAPNWGADKKAKIFVFKNIPLGHQYVPSKSLNVKIMDQETGIDPTCYEETITFNSESFIRGEREFSITSKAKPKKGVNQVPGILTLQMELVLTPESLYDGLKAQDKNVFINRARQRVYVEVVPQHVWFAVEYETEQAQMDFKMLTLTQEFADSHYIDAKVREKRRSIVRRKGGNFRIDYDAMEGKRLLSQSYVSEVKIDNVSFFEDGEKLSFKLAEVDPSKSETINMGEVGGHWNFGTKGSHNEIVDNYAIRGRNAFGVLDKTFDKPTSIGKQMADDGAPFLYDDKDEESALPLVWKPKVKTHPQPGVVEKNTDGVVEEKSIDDVVVEEGGSNVQQNASKCIRVDPTAYFCVDFDGKDIDLKLAVKPDAFNGDATFAYDLTYSSNPGQETFTSIYPTPGRLYLDTFKRVTKLDNVKPDPGSTVINLNKVFAKKLYFKGAAHQSVDGLMSILYAGRVFSLEEAEKNF